MKNVLIADAHPIVIKGLASILKKDEAYKIVAKSNDENELKNHISLKSPDIIIILAWNFKNEIINACLKNNFVGKFLIPFPNDLKLITGQ